MADKQLKKPPKPGNMPDFTAQPADEPELQKVSPEVSGQVVIDDLKTHESGDKPSDPLPIVFAGEKFEIIVPDEDLAAYFSMLVATAETAEDQLATQQEVFRMIIKGGDPEYKRFLSAWKRVGQEYYKKLMAAKAAGEDEGMDSFFVFQEKLFKNFADGAAEAYDPKE